ncbi:hypothetical protein [Paenibacillus sp. JZ16]|uniref:hypothetical protein n=1 Tax=Paenibacillus sp. JZ16 TaxID=1906272 RepID=UPI00188AD798|nr:hypothetical protein [Paenibacillus sp. JZ16]
MGNQESEELLFNNVKKLDELLSRFMGFDVQTELKKKDQENEYDTEVTAHFPGSISPLNLKIANDLLEASAKILERQLEDSEGNFNHSIFLTHVQETALSLIFDSYDKSQPDDILRIHRFIEEVSDVGGRTYESAAVSLGIVYFQEDAMNKAKKSFKDANMEFLPLEKATPFMELYYGEKAFLRLIDNRSMALVLNETFAVIGVLRKKNDCRSISSELEEHIFTYNMNAVLELVYKNTIDKVIASKKEIFENIKSKQPELTDENATGNINFFLEQLNNIIEVVHLENQTRKYPDFLYVSVVNDRLDFYTQNRMTVSLVNGIWKVRHYDLFIASILQNLMVKKLIDTETFKQNKEGYFRLFKTFIDLSREQKSSVYIIIESPDIIHGIEESKAEVLLKGTGFLHSDRERRSLLAIKRGKENANLIDLDPYLIQSLSTVDGAVVLDSNLNVLSFGETISVPDGVRYKGTFGTGSTAAQFASKSGIAVKVSEDGDITLYIDQRIIMKL